MVADLVQCVCYQKCHDPECKKIDFKSPGKCSSHYIEYTPI